MRSFPVVVVLATLAGTGVQARTAVPRASTASAAATARSPRTAERIAIDSVGRPAGTRRGAVLELRLEARVGRWFPEADDGRSVEVQAFGEAGRPLQIPGPLVRVPAGTEVRVTVHNALDSTLVLTGLFDRPRSATGRLAGPLGATGMPRGPGVPPPVRLAPGETRELRFRLDAEGTYLYRGRTSGDASEHGQLRDDALLSGAIVVDPVGASPRDERVMVIGAWREEQADRPGLPWGEVFVINGKSWPHTARLVYDAGDTVRWRIVNATPMAHPMHLHGFYFRVDAVGNSVVDSVLAPDRRRQAVTETVRAWGTLAMTWVPSRPGNWIFHCHFTEHVSHALVLHAPAATVVAASAAHAGHGGGAAMGHDMRGLVVGLTVREPRDAPRHVAAASAPRALRLLVQERAGASPVALGYVLQRGAEPRTDSIAVPGTPIVLERGQPVRITVVNRMRAATSVHWHGIELESFPDGVPGWSGSAGKLMPPIAPGDSFVAAFTPPRAGTFMYHAHMDEGTQIGAGLYAPLIVLAPGRTLDPATDHIVLFSQTRPGDRSTPWLVNGRETPDTLVLRAGVAHRLRLINIRANGIARLRVHGAGDSALVAWRPVAKDGADLPDAAARPRPAAGAIGAGEILDVELTIPPGDYQMDVILPFDNSLQRVVPIRVR